MEQQEIPVIICFNKTDLATTEQMQQLEKDYENSGCQVITVREELDIIKSYMTIINIRYNNEISIEYKVDENLLDILMLKLILQPLVENAVHHGMRQKEGKGELCISVYALDDKLMEVSVRDNGVGIPTLDEPEGHYGLNIMTERSRQLNAQLTISKGEQGGTIVKITLPHTLF